MVDAATKTAVGKIPILKTNAGPRDKEAWVARLKEEYNSLITYIKSNKESDTDWFRLEANKEGTYTKYYGKKKRKKFVKLHRKIISFLFTFCNRNQMVW